MDLHARALSKRHPELRQFLDPQIILPYLSATQLLTKIQVDEVQHVTMRRDQQIDKIISILPTKGRGWWDKFFKLPKTKLSRSNLWM